MLPNRGAPAPKTLAQGQGAARREPDQGPAGERQDALASALTARVYEVDKAARSLLVVDGRHLQGISRSRRRVVSRGRWGRGAPPSSLLQVGERVLADVAHAHATASANTKRAVHQTAAVLALAREVLVQVERVRVHGEEREPGVVEVADGAAGPVLITSPRGSPRR